MRAMWLGFAAAIIIALLAAGGLSLIEGSAPGNTTSSSTRL